MNITKRPIIQKTGKKLKAKNVPSKSDREHWERVIEVPCIVGPIGCKGRTTIHHCFTGAGGRKNHQKVLPLCLEHHIGAEGIDGRIISKKQWQDKYGSEEFLLELLGRELIRIELNL